MSKLMKLQVEIDSGYKSVVFKLFGVRFLERIPKVSMKSLDFVWAERTAIKTKLGLPITYKDMRFSLTPEGKKKADMALITYFNQKHTRDAQNTPWATKLHYRWLYLCYFPELAYIDRHTGTKSADNYLMRWGYKQNINPSFVELIHGTDVNSALFAIENID